MDRVLQDVGGGNGDELGHGEQGFNLVGDVDLKLQSMQQESEQTVPRCKRAVACLTVVQALWRPLKTDEKRDALVAKCKAGVDAKAMMDELPPALNLAISAHVQAMKNESEKEDSAHAA